MNYIFNVVIKMNMLNPLFVKILRLWNFFWGCLLRFHYFISIFLSSQKSQESYYFCYSAICRLFVFPEFLQLLELHLFMINFIRCLISDFHFSQTPKLLLQPSPVFLLLRPCWMGNEALWWLFLLLHPAVRTDQV